MNEKKLHSWWRSRYPAWAAVTAPLVRLHLESTIQSPCVATILRVSFLTSEMPKLPLTSHKIASRLSGLSKAATPQVLLDLQSIGAQPLADFLMKYPDYEKRFDPYSASIGAEFEIQSYEELVQGLAKFAKANREAIVSEVTRLEEFSLETNGQKLRAADQVELCFCHSHSLAIADRLESLVSEISEYLNAFGRLNESMSHKCDEVRNGYKEVVKEVGLERRPAVLVAWLERVQAWLNQFSSSC